MTLTTLIFNVRAPLRKITSQILVWMGTYIYIYIYIYIYYTIKHKPAVNSESDTYHQLFLNKFSFCFLFKK